MTEDERTPRPSRPHMPAYGIDPSEDGLLPWPWAEQRLRESHNYWLATARPDGRAHLMPVWALWSEGELCFSTDGVKAANLRRDPRCSISTEHAREAVILEGRVRTIPRGDEWDAVRQRYATKYGDGFPDGSPLFALRPAVAFAFTEAPGQFTQTATRWTFAGR